MTVVLVGGGSILVEKGVTLKGVSNVIVPPKYWVSETILPHTIHIIPRAPGIKIHMNVLAEKNGCGKKEAVEYDLWFSARNGLKDTYHECGM